MELRERDVAENQNIRSSRRVAEYSLTFEMVLPGGRVQFCLSNSPAGRLSPIDKPAKATRSGDPQGRVQRNSKTIHQVGSQQASKKT